MPEQLSPILKRTGENGLLFHCPGCSCNHLVHYGECGGPRWDWNGDVNRPTLLPSILTRWNYGISNETHVCHLFIEDGMLNYQGDCTHALKGKITPMVEF